MADLTLTDEDRVAIQAALIAERESGVAVPLIPADVDLDGDGTADSFGLDEHDNVIIVPGVPLEHTVYVSDGDDIIEHQAEGDG
ncbi:hypothetical protein SEA_FUZZBUSTER_48 [Microbacterium phage FuzzBuster]|uniref:Uncharacterized protein n=1 Tax=Microbacterium phage FuzzBuster TaxID=2590935 RepID=A0A516KV31_9CAUD|nr:hypothetical protein SEA_FUZZBUSTER_48 [Microbacterium phage FuzzBuster]